jgi:hypothetical protein
VLCLSAALEVADIFRGHGAAWRLANADHLSLDQLKAMSAIERCRTAALGGHVARCEDCAHTLIAYNSCRNRRLFPKMLAAAHTSGRLEFFGQHSALADHKGFAAFIAPLRKTEWVVYAKEPFGGPQARARVFVALHL